MKNAHPITNRRREGCINRFTRAALLLLLLPSLVATPQQPVCISLGENCAPALHLKRVGLITEYGPFDWIKTPFAGLYNILENDFADFLAPEALAPLTVAKTWLRALPFDEGPQQESTIVINNKTGCFFGHDFSAHGLADLPAVQAKYARRINRLREALASGAPVYFFRTNITQQEAAQLATLLSKRFPRLRYTLCAMLETKPAKPWRIANVRTFVLAKRYAAAHENTPSWDQAFISLGLTGQTSSARATRTPLAQSSEDNELIAYLNDSDEQRSATTHVVDEETQTVAYISLGANCAAGLHLVRHQLLTRYYPFDWIETPFDGLCYLLKTGFKDFLDKNALTPQHSITTWVEPDLDRAIPSYPRQRVRNQTSGCEFVHDFIDAALSNYPAVAEKYARRIERFYRTIAQAKHVYFFRTEISRAQAKILRNLLREVFPNLSFTLVVPTHKRHLTKPWHLASVRPFYLGSHATAGSNKPEWDNIFAALGLAHR